jgi:short-subunit dehydrogenase
MHKNLFDLTGRRILISGSREVAKRMIQKRAGKIINICSLMSEDPIL